MLFQEHAQADDFIDKIIISEMGASNCANKFGQFIVYSTVETKKKQFFLL